MFGKFGDMMKAKEQASKLKSALEQETLEGVAINGMIKVILNGNLEIQSVELDDKILTPENKDQIQNGIKEAFNDAQSKLQQLMIRKISSGEISM